MSRYCQATEGYLVPGVPFPHGVAWLCACLMPGSVPTLQSLVQGGLPGSGMPSELPQLIPVFPGGTPLLPPVVGGSIPVSSPLPPASFGLVMDPSRKLAASVLDALDSPGPTLDPLDLLPYSEARLDALDSFGSARSSLDKTDSFLGETLVGTLSLFSLDSAAPSLVSEALHPHSTCPCAQPSPGQGRTLGHRRAAHQGSAYGLTSAMLSTTVA